MNQLKKLAKTLDRNLRCTNFHVYTLMTKMQKLLGMLTFEIGHTWGQKHGAIQISQLKKKSFESK